jgi:hypothetical protein
LIVALVGCHETGDIADVQHFSVPERLRDRGSDTVRTVAMKVFEVRAYWSAEGNDWCAVNDELPVAAEAPTLDALLVEVKAQAAEMAELNGLAAHGEEIKVRLIETVEVRAAA